LPGSHEGDGSPKPATRCCLETEFDQSGTTGLGDFVIFAEEYLRGTSAAGYCP
jgi:hypothetical protein